MSPSSKAPGRERRAWRLALPALLFVAALGWLALSATPRTRVEAKQPAQDVIVSPAAALEYASDGLPIHPRGSAAAPQGIPVHPHGFTPVHERIYRENNLVGQLDGAMDVKDVHGMRRLLAEYRAEYPEDSHEMQVGYQLIADCLEFPDDAAKRAAARDYYQTETASGLRRYIRRHCLEPAY